MAAWVDSIALQPSPTAAADARRFVRRALGRLPAAPRPPGAVWLGDDLLVAANELITNAIVHARTEFTLTVACDAAGIVRVSVTDYNTRRPDAHDVPRDATSGRGLSMIAGLGLRWGIDAVDGGKVVWTEGDLTHG
ncbi:MAG TPA: ATP-binding protein [Acidimicrobiales bacterium]|nr:ATP-binding protein [Acidimicrobiales bacterium]